MRVPHVIAAWLASTMLVSFSLLSAPAFAEPGTVHLKNGGRIHGEIMEVHPGKFVSVMLADGQVRRFEWKEVDRVADADAAPEAAQEAAPAAAPEHPELLTIFGLKLGTTKEALAAACEQRHLTWTDGERPTCAGTAKQLDASFSARFRMCDDRTCKAVVSVTPPRGAWSRTFGAVKKSLLDSHGPSKDSMLELSGCHGEVEACFARGEVKAQAAWRLDGGHRVDVQLRLEGGAPRDIAVWYGLGQGRAPAAAPVASAPVATGPVEPVAPDAPPPPPGPAADTGLTEPHWGLVIAGAITFGTAYLIGVIATAAVTEETGGDTGLATGIALIPLAGPWIGFPVAEETGGELTGGMIAGIVIVGLTQATGFTLMLVGASMDRPVEFETGSLSIAPMFDANSAGLAAFGEF